MTRHGKPLPQGETVKGRRAKGEGRIGEAGTRNITVEPQKRGVFTEWTKVQNKVLQSRQKCEIRAGEVRRESGSGLKIFAVKNSLEKNLHVRLFAVK